MERKTFLRNSFGFLGLAMAAPALLRAGKPEAGMLEPETCSAGNSETEGPFPTHTPSSLVSSNIVSDRTGVAFNINITINNVNGACGPLAGALVDIWHCDKDGNYSEYGGTGMQPTNYTAYHFLRGRQTTDANGLVSFTSIFPGWYTGRATHIHVHVYSSTGTSLLVTQIAFPEGTGSAVNLVNAATAYGYAKGMTGYTYNATDNVFSDGVSNELASVTGTVDAGFTLSHTVFVNGPTLGIDQSSAELNTIGQNYPNPFTDTTTIPISLATASKVSLQIFDLGGRLIGKPVENDFASGANSIVLDRSKLHLSGGYYIYKITVENDNGRFVQNRKMLVQ